MKSFIQFFHETAELANAPIGHIEFDKQGDDYFYPFTINNKKYQVSFTRRTIEDVKRNITTEDAYDIEFVGPNQYGPTKLGNPLEKYKPVILAVRRFIEKYNPEGIMFSGTTPTQTRIYALLYNMLLKPFYTKISDYDYLRNDLNQKDQILKNQARSKEKAILRQQHWDRVAPPQRKKK